MQLGEQTRRGRSGGRLSIIGAPSKSPQTRDSGDLMLNETPINTNSKKLKTIHRLDLRIITWGI